MNEIRKAFGIGNFLVLAIACMLALLPSSAWALASNNIPLDSPIYLYLEKLTGFGLVNSEVKGIKPFSKAEAARLVSEAEKNLPSLENEPLAFAKEIIDRLHQLIPRELAFYTEPEKAAWFDYNPVAFAKLRYVYLDGVPRSYSRDVRDPGHQSAFGFIGGDLRPEFSPILHQSGTEGTPLLENNEGIVYRRGNSFELRWAAEGFIADKVSLMLEPIFLTTPKLETNERLYRLALQKGYVKIGGGGIELEVGRDENWFGPGYRGALTLTDNAGNFDLIKLSSPEPVDVKWVKKYLGNFKYSFIFSRFDETGTGDSLRHPYFIGMKLSLKPTSWFEIGGNFVRQEGGPGFSGKTNLQDLIFGGGYTNKNNTIAGVDLRFRIPSLRNTEIYGEYVGEDSALFWPFVESYVAGFYIPRLTASGKDDLRFEYYWGHQILYTDFKFPAGYTYRDLPVGHSQGGGAEEFFLRYSHWFSVRNNLAFEYIHSERGNVGRVTVDAAGNFDPNGSLQAVERKNALRAFWQRPLYGDVDLNLMYGWERIHNRNLVAGADRTNQIFKLDVSYKY